MEFQTKVEQNPTDYKEEDHSNGDNHAKFPYEIKWVEESDTERLLKDFLAEKNGFVKVGPKNFVMFSEYKKYAERLYNFESRQEDIWVATFPRSGTTWMQELVWLIANDFDFSIAKREKLTKRVPYFEICTLVNDHFKRTILEENKNFSDRQQQIEAAFIPEFELLSKINGPRFMKTHLPMSILPPSVMKNRAKVIYVARNPKDVIVSYYHLSRGFRNFNYFNDFKTYCEYMQNDLIVYSPYWEHIKEGWEARHEPNVLFIFYEEMCKNLPDTIKKVAHFLEKEINVEQIEKLCDHLNIANFRNNRAVNKSDEREFGFIHSNEPSFIRNGKATLHGWPKEYTPEVAKKIEAWIEQNLSDTTLRFPQ